MQSEEPDKRPAELQWEEFRTAEMDSFAEN
jgi:hypothetical protein